MIIRAIANDVEAPIFAGLVSVLISHNLFKFILAGPYCFVGLNIDVVHIFRSNQKSKTTINALFQIEINC